jgi:hypothetical protein
VRKNITAQVLFYSCATCFCGCLILSIYLLLADTRPEEVAFRFRMGSRASAEVIGRCGGSLVVFNQSDPNLGVFYNVSGGTNLIHFTGFDRCGIYYQEIQDPAARMTWWTLMFSVWYLIAIFGIISTLLFAKIWRPNSRRNEHVPSQINAMRQL